MDANMDERDNAMATFLNGMDARAVLYMFSQINDRQLDSLKGKLVEQMRTSMMFQGEVDIDQWTRRTTAFLNGPAKDIDWNGFNVFAAGGVAPETPARGTTESASAQVLGQLATPTGLVPDVSTQILATLEKINSQLNSTPTGRSALNQHGAAQGQSASRLNELLAEAGGAGGDASEKDGEPPAKKTKTVFEAVWDGTIPLSDQQRVVRLELQKMDYETLHGFFGALRRIAATIDTAEDEYRRFIEGTAHSEAMVYELFIEAVAQQKFLSAENRDMLEVKYTTLIKAKLLSAKDFNFVKAAADAQGQIMKDLKDIRPPRRDDRPPRARDERPKCFECDRQGHKSFECKSTQEDRDKHKAARAAARGAQ